jgi:hypothetical protein
MKGRLLLVLIVASFLAGCDDRAPEWTGWVYPNRNDLTLSVSLGGFKTFEQCQQASIDRLRGFSDPDAGDYECGFKCRWSPTLGINVCKETRK